MKIGITGASGLVGSALVPYLRAQGHEVMRLVRTNESATDALWWDPGAGILSPDDLEGIDAVIHLAGANVAGGRWTKKRKQEILDSRVFGVRTLVKAIRACSKGPSIVISASASGIYGDRGDEWLDESSAHGQGFLAEVCQKWEQEWQPVAQLGVRVATLRLGLVLSAQGGALGKMLPAFKCGFGGRLGMGKQWMSWIDEEDLVAIFQQVLSDPELHGPINAVSPEPVRNETFTKTLGAVLKRPTWLGVPAFALRLIFGEMADAALLSSARVKPQVLEESGFHFRSANLEMSLAKILNR